MIGAHTKRNENSEHASGEWSFLYSQTRKLANLFS